MKLTWMRAAGVAGACAIAGAAAGIAGGAASPTTTGTAATATPATATATAAAATPGAAARRGPGRARFGRAVHEEAVVLNRAGTAWITETRDGGVVKSVSGTTLVITEGTTAVPYQDASVTVPAGATIRRNGKKAALTDLKVGDHVVVISSSDGTTVFAADSTFRSRLRPGGPAGKGWHGGPNGHHRRP